MNEVTCVNCNRCVPQMLPSDTVKFNLQLLLQVIRLQLTIENPIPYIGHKITPYGFVVDDYPRASSWTDI